ncbi:hypothetical protein K474DRAFT_1679695 [Panus rudis PR-1116 ss-1]|nr:hypothetical protein K474DRAFT_1679695 [Panus rudis PR-1116 ss-1]
MTLNPYIDQLRVLFMPQPLWLIVEWERGIDQKQWLTERVSKDIDLNRNQLTKYGKGIAVEFDAKFPRTIVKSIYKRTSSGQKEFDRMETEEEALQRTNGRTNQIVKWIHNHQDKLGAKKRKDAPLPKYLELQQNNGSNKSRAKSARDLFISAHPEISKNVRAAAKAEGVKERQEIQRRVNVAYTEAIANADMSKYQTLADKDKQAKAAERQTPATENTDAQSRKELLDQLQYSLFNTAVQLGKKTNTVIFIMAGGLNENGQTASWMMSSRSGLPGDIIPIVQHKDGPCQGFNREFDNFISRYVAETGLEGTDKFAGVADVPVASLYACHEVPDTNSNIQDTVASHSKTPLSQVISDSPPDPPSSGSLTTAERPNQQVRPVPQPQFVASGEGPSSTGPLLPVDSLDLATWSFPNDNTSEIHPQAGNVDTGDQVGTEKQPTNADMEGQVVAEKPPVGTDMEDHVVAEKQPASADARADTVAADARDVEKRCADANPLGHGDVEKQPADATGNNEKQDKATDTEDVSRRGTRAVRGKGRTSTRSINQAKSKPQGRVKSAAGKPKNSRFWSYVEVPSKEANEGENEENLGSGVAENGTRHSKRKLPANNRLHLSVPSKMTRTTSTPKKGRARKFVTQDQAWERARDFTELLKSPKRTKYKKCQHHKLREGLQYKTRSKNDGRGFIMCVEPGCRFFEYTTEALPQEHINLLEEYHAELDTMRELSNELENLECRAREISKTRTSPNKDNGSVQFQPRNETKRGIAPWPLSEVPDAVPQTPKKTTMRNRQAAPTTHGLGMDVIDLTLSD